MSHRHRLAAPLALALALASFALAPLAALAARRPAAPLPGAFLERAVLRLDLSADQKEEIRGVVRSHRSELESGLAGVGKAR
jgi:Spy/CpxP family protein refolding chaperone